MKLVGIVQARMGSTRLPGKVLADLGGRPMLARVVERLRASKRIDEIVIATSTAGDDDAIEELGKHLGVRVFRGSEDDVLDRYDRAASLCGADAVSRVTADCPLVDAGVADRVAERFFAGDADYVSNTLERTYPRGLDVEVFSREALRRAAREARRPFERAHVTPYIHSHPDTHRAQVRHGTDESDHRWTVDTPADLALTRALYDRLGDRPFSWLDVLALVKAEPALEEINRWVEQKCLYLG